MIVKTKVNTLSKKLLGLLLARFDFKLFSKSDFSKNGLKPYLIDFFLLQSKGLLHIGGHIGQEASHYSRFNFPVIWIEGNPSVFEILKKNVSRFEHTAILGLVSDIDGLEIPFYLTSNDSESASVFPLAKNHKWSNLENTGSIVLKTTRLDSLLSVGEIRNSDFWVIDVQGSELQVIRGAGEYLHKYCRYALIEISTAEFYSGGSSWVDVVNEMNNNGFVQLWNPNSPHEEILFINSRYTTG